MMMHIVIEAHLFGIFVQKSQIPKTVAAKRSPVYEPLPVFKTDDYFRQLPVTLATEECSVAVMNGTVSSSCNSDVSSDVPSELCSKSTRETDFQESSYAICSDNTVVKQISAEDSAHKSVVANDALFPNDSI